MYISDKMLEIWKNKKNQPMSCKSNPKAAVKMFFSNLKKRLFVIYSRLISVPPVLRNNTVFSIYDAKGEHCGVDYGGWWVNEHGCNEELTPNSKEWPSSWMTLGCVPA